jgi:class 3 adenylate cyclase
MKAQVKFFKELIKKGGVKLKYIGFIVMIILVTVTLLSLSIIGLMKNSIEQKSIEIATTIIKSISDSSVHALLERTYDNELNLSEMISELKKSKIEGVIDISIFARVKAKQDFQFVYLSGFGRYKHDEIVEDRTLLGKFLKLDSNIVSSYDAKFLVGDKEIETYLFIKPIRYVFKDKEIFLGVTTLQYDKDAINGIIDQVIIVSFFITLFILIVAIILLYLAGSHFTKPILEIADAASKISKGQLDMKLEITTNDEIELLADEFNTMAKRLREHSKMQKFISSSTLDMINHDEREKLELGGEYKEMTFLFSDIRNFTAMSETKKPDEVVRIINFYLNIQSNIIKSYGGDIDKFVGDEVMASFYGENSIDKAIEAAIDIQKTLQRENKKREKDGFSTCFVGIGISHGEVIVGNVGSNDRMDYTSIGSIVNVAARLCANAREEEILIEENTFHNSKQHFESKKITPINAKGISKPVQIRLISLKDDDV